MFWGVELECVMDSVAKYNDEVASFIKRNILHLRFLGLVARTANPATRIQNIAGPFPFF